MERTEIGKKMLIPIKIYESITKHGMISKKTLFLVAYFFHMAFHQIPITHWNADFLVSFVLFWKLLEFAVDIFFFLRISSILYEMSFVCVSVCACVCHMNPYFSANNTHTTQAQALANSSPKMVLESCKTDCINCTDAMLRDIRLERDYHKINAKNWMYFIHP